MLALVVSLENCSYHPDSTADGALARAAAGGVYKVGTPYKVENDWFYPAEDPKYDSIGIASWYGKKFHGKLTANGETFDMNLITAAHPTLPLPILARVTNLANKRQLVVRINDRGPFLKDREIDLSRRAAELLGFRKVGITKVRVEYLRRAPLYDSDGNIIDTSPPRFITKKPVISDTERQAYEGQPLAPVETHPLKPPQKRRVATKPEPKPLIKVAAQTKPDINYNIQIGAFREHANAKRLRDELRIYNDIIDDGGGVQIVKSKREGDVFYQVRLVRTQNSARARAKLAQLADAGFRATLIAIPE